MPLGARPDRAPKGMLASDAMVGTRRAVGYQDEDGQRDDALVLIVWSPPEASRLVTVFSVVVQFVLVVSAWRPPSWRCRSIGVLLAPATGYQRRRRAA